MRTNTLPALTVSTALALALGLTACLPNPPAQEPDPELVVEEDAAPLGPTEVAVIPLQYADATELVNTAMGLLSERNGPRITADSRTNSLIVHGTPAQVENVRQLAAGLDVRVGP